MISDDEKTLETNKGPKKKKNGKSPLKKILIVFFIMGILAGCGCAGYYYYFTDKPGVIEKSGLAKEILEFTVKFMPNVHSGIRSVSDEIVITENEINRINEIEKKFPDQAKITNSEKKVWDKNLSTLTKFLEKHEKEVRSLYVSYRVNQETGQALIDETKEALSDASNEIIAPSKILTDKIRALEEAKSLLDKAKEQIGLN